MKRWFQIACLALAASWLAFAVAGRPAAAWAAQRAGAAIARATQGKVLDPTTFVRERFRELLWLATLLLLCCAVQWLAGRFGFQRWRRHRWAFRSLVAFLLLNAWVWAAMDTAIFWGALGAGGGVQNLIQFHFKRVLLGETAAPVRAVLVGSSQTRAQIDENLLNQSFNGRLWATELHYPGSHGYDVLLAYQWFRREHPQFVICYLTEPYFYGGSHAPASPAFLRWNDLPYLISSGGWRHLSRDEIGSGLLGSTLPLYRCREAFAHRLLGSQTASLKQSRYDRALPVDLKHRAEESARGFHFQPDTAFQKQAFEKFVAECEHDHTRVILLAGMMNPLFTREQDPGIRADMLAFIEDLRRRHGNVLVIGEKELPIQTPADYDDLSHVNEAMQRRFTLFLADYLRNLTGAKEQAGPNR